jgi:hypothetical protein
MILQFISSFAFLSFNFSVEQSRLDVVVVSKRMSSDVPSSEGAAVDELSDGYVEVSFFGSNHCNNIKNEQTNKQTNK